MYINSKEAVGEPLTTDHGEIIYEVIGASEAHGSAAGHSIAFIELPPGCASLPHYHKIEEETYIIQQGVGVMAVDGAAYELHPGQACLIKPGMMHQIKNQHLAETLVFIAVCSPPWEPSDTYMD